jgi:minor extracellular serine protease Vpr
MQSMRLLTAVVAAATTALVAHAPVMSAAASAPVAAVPADLSESATRWFVELSGTPAGMGGNAANVRREQASVRALAGAAGVKMQERFRYETLWNGFSIEASAADASRLKGIPGVRAVYPVVDVEAPPQPQTDGVVPDVMSSIVQTGVDVARSQLGLTGKGIKVGIIDTGIDYDHPDLGGSFGPGFKVAYGWDFVGDNYDASGESGSPIPVPDRDPDDCGGHGTHVAGITGAKAASANGVTGVAPDVTLGAYRVFGCQGSSSADVIVAALERAFLDGMDVVNMSLGAAYQWPQYPSALVSNRLVQKGVVVVASAGNNGANGGTFSLGAPGVGRDVIAVSSFDNVAITLSSFTVSADDTAIGYAPATAAPLPPSSGSLPMARTGTASSTADACVALPADSLAGKAALIRRGGCTFYAKAANAMNAGAAAVVLYNNAPGRLTATVAGAPPITIPVVSISDAEGLLIDGRLAAGDVTLTWTADNFSAANPTGDLMSSFSSYGLSPDLDFKPDVGAPGGFIFSTYPIELGRYATLSGTSMSAPHVAGTVALLLEAKPKTKARDVRALLQNTAAPKPWFGNPALGFLEPAFRQGAGMVQIDRVVGSTVAVTPGKLALGESEAGPQARRLTVTNSGRRPVTLALSWVNTLSTNRSTPAALGAPNGVSHLLGDATVAFAAPTVTVPANGSATVDLVITPATTPLGGMYGGYVVLTPDSGEPYRVPFGGFIGDYQSISATGASAFGLPALTRLVGDSFFFQPNGASYTMQGDDVPFFLVHFDHAVRRVEFEIVNARSGARLHPVFSNIYDFDYVGRNSHRQSFFAFDWNGTRRHSNGRGNELTKFVPNGRYIVNIRTLKANGDAANPAHWELWTSPVVTIARP